MDTPPATAPPDDGDYVPNLRERPVDPDHLRALRDSLFYLHRPQIMARRRGMQSQLAEDFRLFLFRTAANLHELALAGVSLPEGFLDHYRTDPAEFEKVLTPHKYRIRPYNLSRDLLRLVRMAPELLDSTQPRQDVLELSPGACALQELLAPLGHRLSFAEYGTSPGTPYYPLHLETGASPVHFDGRQLPFPFPDQCADLVLAFQCLDSYTESRDNYPAYLAELERLARRKYVVIFNSLRPGHQPDDEIASFKALFSHITGLTWTICRDEGLLTAIWHRPQAPQG